MIAQQTGPGLADKIGSVSRIVCLFLTVYHCSFPSTFLSSLLFPNCLSGTVTFLPYFCLIFHPPISSSFRFLFPAISYCLYPSFCASPVPLCRHLTIVAFEKREERERGGGKGVISYHVEAINLIGIAASCWAVGVRGCDVTIHGASGIAVHELRNKRRRKSNYQP